MGIFVRLISSCISILLEIELLALLIRAVMSWVMPDRDNRFYQMIYGLTEPVISPIRSLLYRFRFVQMCPIDLSYLATCLLLEAILMMLP